jgi:hypothetical protein
LTIEETIKILSVIRVAYPSQQNKTDEEEAEHRIKLWHEQFKNVPYELVNAALDIHIKLNKYPPVISELLEHLKDMAGKQRTQTEVLRIIREAVSNSLYHSQEEFNKMPLAVQNFVGNPGQLRAWAEMPIEQFNFQVNNLLKDYNATVKAEAVRKAVPEDIKALMGNYADNFSIEDTQNKQG